MTSPRRVHFTDSLNESYNYDSDSAPSPIATSLRVSPFLFSAGPTQSPANLYHSRSLSDTPSPVYSPISLPGSPVRDYLQWRTPPLSPIQTETLAQYPKAPGHGRNDSLSSPYAPLELPPTPNLRPVELPPVDDTRNDAEPLTITLHSSLLYRAIDLDLANNLEHIIVSLPLEPAVTPPRPTMIMWSNILPWKVHVIMPALDLEVTMQDVVAVLYNALRTRVTAAEIHYFGEHRASRVYAAFNNRVEHLGEEERQKGPRRIDFLGKNTRFLGLTPTDDPDIWKICLSKSEQ